MPLRQLDDLQLYFAVPYQLTDKLAIRQPMMGDVISMGEQEYFSIVRALTAIPSDMKAPLWDMGKDWTEVSDFDFFIMTTAGLPVEKTRVFFGDLDFSKFKVYMHTDGRKSMYNPESDVTIDEYTHHMLSDYICRLHSITKKPERAGNELTKQVLIDEDRQNRAYQATQKFESSLLPLISSAVNSPGFKYKLHELPEIGVFAFYDAISRLALIKQTEQLATGIYTGNVKATKANLKKLDWMADIHS